MNISNTEYQIAEQLIKQIEQQPAQTETTNLDLATLGKPYNLSVNQVQRLFSKWAGISPKRFQQFLTAKSLQSRLQNAQSLLDVSLDSGLSSVSQVHSHFVHFHAMSPNEYRNDGLNLNINHGFYDCPFGLAHIATTEKGICWLAFIDNTSKDSSIEDLLNQWPSAQFKQDHTMHRALVASLFSLSENKPLFLHIKGTNFQLKVWEALLNVPLGQCASYQTIASSIDKPKASRAVGSAIGKNPIAWLIPCHRVIRATGVIGHYRWGEQRKKALLGWEAGKVA